MRSLIGVLILALFNVLSIHAQQKDSIDIYELSLEELSRISVYSTTRTKVEDALEAPATLVVVNKDQIKERGYTSLLQLLEDLPDFKVDIAVDPRWQNDITSRGVRYMDKLIILLNGVRISSPTNEIIPIFENYPLNMAEQVEIFYGPASALYGADAFSGIINIITKKADSGYKVDASVWGSGIIGALNGGVNAFYSTKIGNDISVTASGQFFYDEQPFLGDEYPEEYEGIDQSLESGTFNTIFGPITPTTPVDSEKAYPLEAWSTFLGLEYKDFNFQFFNNHSHNPSTTANSPHNSVYNEDQLFGHDIKMFTGKYLNKGDRIVSSSQVTFSKYSLDERSNFRNVFTFMEPAYLYARSWKLKGEQLFTVSASDNLEITTGVTYERFFSIPRSNNIQSPVENKNIEDAVVANSIAPLNQNGIAAELVETNYNNIGGLVQLSWNSEHVDITAGARVDRDDRFATTVNPRLGMVFKPSHKLTIKTLFGTAYLAPSPQNIFERYGSFSTTNDGLNYTASFFNLPNPELDPQRISTYEVSGSFFISESLSLNMTSYYSKVTNFISPVNTFTNGDLIESLYPNQLYNIGGYTIPIDVIQVNDNLGEADIYGGNIQLQYRWQGYGKWNGDILMTQSLVDGNIDIDEEGPAVERNLPGVAPSIFRFGGTVRNSFLSINMRLSLVGKQRVFNVNGVQDTNNDENPNNDSKYQELSGYQLLNTNINFKVTEKFSLSLIGRNLLNQKYRNVNIGAAPATNDGSSGSAEVEFSNGAPQNPIRIQLGAHLSL